MYAIVETGGKQYRVTKGDLVKVEHVAGNHGDVVEFDQVLFIQGDAGTTVGTPTVPGAKVIGRIKRQAKDRKIIVFKFKRRKNYRRKYGHRQPYTLLAIEDIIS